MTARLRTRGSLVGRVPGGGLLALLALFAAGRTAAAAERPGVANRFGTLMRLGDAAGRSGDWAAAVSFYRQATDADPGRPRGHLALGTALIEAGSPEAAAQAFREAL